MTTCCSLRWAALGGSALVAAGVAVFAVLGTGPTTAQPGKADPAAPGANDHAMFGGSLARNMANMTAKGLPEKIDLEKDVLWKADLGSKAYGGPIVAGGKVYVGTNNQRPRNPRDARKSAEGEVEPIDKGVLMVFDEKTGKFLWQAVFDKLPSGRVNDWPDEGICSTPTVEGNRVYFTTNRCTVVCADANGFADGNQGFQGERFKDPTDADILWEYDMMRELNVFPHNMTAACPLIVGDIVYVVTANGVDEGHLNIPSPLAPSFIALDKNTGKLLWKSNAPGKDIMHGQWSNPVYAEIGGVRQVIFPGGDGWLHAFVPETGEPLWKFDCNPKNAVYELGGTGTRNDFIGTPVVYDNKVYIGVGQDPEHSTGIGHFWCVNPAGKKGDISPTLAVGEKDKDGKVKEQPNPNSGLVWRFGGEDDRKWALRDFKFGRTMSTACIVDDIVYIAELTGILHCLNAQTGEHYWQHDTKASIWGSAYYADGKVYLANDQGDLYVFRHDRKPEKFDEVEAAKDAPDMKAARQAMLAVRKKVADKYLISKTEFDAPIRSTPVAANGVLYVMSEKTLYAIKGK